MAGNNGQAGGFAVALALAVCIAGVVAAVIIIVMAIEAYTAPYSCLVFLVPFPALFVIGYGTAYLIDHQRSRRLGIAATATVIGSAVFLVMLNVMAGDSPVLRNAGALLSVLGFFSLFAVLPAIATCFIVALLCRDLRSALLGHTLVDIEALPAEIIAPIRPYIDNLTHRAGRRFSLTWLFDKEAGRRERYRIHQDELEALYEKAGGLVSRSEGFYRQETALVEAQSARDVARNREGILEALVLAERDGLDVQPQLSSRAPDHIAQLEAEYNGLVAELVVVRDYAADLRAETNELERQHQHLKREHARWVEYATKLKAFVEAERQERNKNEKLKPTRRKKSKSRKKV